jgi:hypothetical protein
MKNIIAQTLGLNIDAAAPKAEVIIEIDGKPYMAGTLASETASEGYYLINAGYGQSNPCFAVPPGGNETAVWQGLASRLVHNPKKGEITALVESLKAGRVTARLA